MEVKEVSYLVYHNQEEWKFFVDGTWYIVERVGQIYSGYAYYPSGGN